MHFNEIKSLLSGERLEFPATLVEQRPERLVLRLGRRAEPLPAGTTTLAYYWPSHPYNVYHAVGPNGATVSFYINLVGPTVIGRDYVAWTDLLLAVLLVPDATLGYRVTLLGEAEIPADLDAATHNHIYAALDEVMRAWPELVRFLSAHSAALLARLP